MGEWKTESGAGADQIFMPVSEGREAYVVGNVIAKAAWNAAEAKSLTQRLEKGRI